MHAKLLEAIYQLAGYLNQQDEVLHQRFDHCDRQLRDTLVFARKPRGSSATGSRGAEANAA